MAGKPQEQLRTQEFPYGPLMKAMPKTQNKGLTSFLEPPRQPMEMHGLYPGAAETGCGLPNTGSGACWYSLEGVSKLRAPH